MSQVSVTINGRQFRMACEDGQEGHLMELARELDVRIEGLRAKFGEIGDNRLTVMAALTVADELAEMGKRLKRIEEEMAAAQEARGAAADRAQSTQAAVAAALTAAAERIEGVTKKLNQSIGSSGVALG
jgi:cell division protein ZapA